MLLLLLAVLRRYRWLFPSSLNCVLSFPFPFPMYRHIHGTARKRLTDKADKKELAGVWVALSSSSSSSSFVRPSVDVSSLGVGVGDWLVIVGG